MIYATVNVTVGDYSSTCDQNIVLYRGDKNVEIRFVIKGNRFTVLDSTYAQMIIRRPSLVSMFSEPAVIQNDIVVLTITEDMIDELTEIGEYTFQIRLYDNSMNARATLPPCENSLIIHEPIAMENSNEVGIATVGYALLTDSETEDTFDEKGEYNLTTWENGDLITDSKLNKIEDAIYTNTKNTNSILNDLDDYATEQYVNEAIESVDVTEQLVEYAKKSDIPTVSNDLTDTLKGNYDTAYNHSQSVHAPSNAQKNSDITQAEIEAKLTGNVTSHSHNKYALNSDLIFRDRIHASMIPAGTSIPSGSDLNTIDFIRVGNYYCSKNVDAQTLQNCPIDVAFMMTVTSPLSPSIDNEETSTWVYRLRTIIKHNTGEQYIQFVSSNSTAGVFTYGEWTKSAFTKDIPIVTNDLTDTLKGNYDTAYNHSQAAHAPSNAQKNSDITKAEIEARLTGDIFSHTHLTPRPGNYFINGYAGMTSDGVMEVAKYQDWHNTSDDSNDYSVRVMCDSSNGNTVRLPQTSGRIALVEDIDAKIASSKERISYRGYPGSTYAYFPLASFVADNSTNYGHITIDGRIGGWEDGNMATYKITMANRSNKQDGNTITSTVQAMGQVGKALDIADIEIYKQEDNSHIAYIKAKYYALWDIAYTVYQHSFIYDGTYSADVPSGTMVWSLSSANKTMLSIDGALSQTGVPVEDSDLVTKLYVDTAIEEANIGGSGGATGDASTHNHDDRYYTESESNSRFYGQSTGKLDVNTRYDGKMYMIQNGSNCPGGSQYGALLGLTYRKLTGNSKPDYMGQIFIPNGDDVTHPNSMFFRTSLDTSWNEWQEVATKKDLENVASSQGMSNTFVLAGIAGWYRIAEGDVDNIAGIFEIRGNANSYHSSTMITTTMAYNKYPSLLGLAHSIYSSSKAGITKTRIVYQSGSTSKKCYLEIYLASDVGLTVTVDGYSTKGWTLLNGEAGEIPTDYTYTELFLTNSKFNGNLAGTADYATRLSNTPNITIGNQTVAFNGRDAITFDVGSMGVAKADHGTHLSLGTTSSTAFRGDYGNTAYNHSQTTHAPSNAQKNSDITSSEIQAKLTGNITTHTHSQYLTSHQDLSAYAKKSDIPTVSNDLTNALKSSYDTAYNHSQSTHAPINAQKNSDITKSEIEAKLTGDITTHAHSQYLTSHQDLSAYAKKTELPTKVSQLTNDKGYLTEHQKIKIKGTTYTQVNGVVTLPDYVVASFKVYNVLDYNISTENDDNTTALQNLVNLVHEAGGGTIFFPVGVYNFKRSLNKEEGTFGYEHEYAILMKSNVSIMGENIENTILKCTEATPYTLFYRTVGGIYDTIHGCTFSNFTVDCYETGNYNRVFGKVFYFQYVKNCVFRDLILKGTIATAMGIDFLSQVEINNVTCIDCGRTFESESSTSGTSGIGIGMGGFDDENFQITNCICVGSGQYGIFIENQRTLGWGGNTENSKGCIISNCVVRNGLYRGIGVRGGVNVIVNNCVSYGNQSDGLYLDNKCVNVKITDNILEANKANGILVKTNSTSEDIDINNNFCKSNAKYGIDLETTTTGLMLRNNVTKKNDFGGLFSNPNVIHVDTVYKNNAFFEGEDIDETSFIGKTIFNELLNGGNTPIDPDVPDVPDDPDDPDDPDVPIDPVESVTIPNADFIKNTKLLDTGLTTSSSGAGVTDYIDISTFSSKYINIKLTDFNPAQGARYCFYSASKALVSTASVYHVGGVKVDSYYLSVNRANAYKYFRIAYNNLGTSTVTIEQSNIKSTMTYDDMVKNTKIGPDGSASTESGSCTTEFVDITSKIAEGCTKVTVKKLNTGGGMRVAQYDANKNSLSTSFGLSASDTQEFTLLSGVAYLRIYIGSFDSTAMVTMLFS